MNLNLVVIILLLVGVALSKLAKNPSKWYIVWCSVVLVLSVTLKSSNYGIVNGGGADTLSYVERYKEASEKNFDYVWQQFIDRYVHGIGDYDVGYVLVEWFFAHIVSSYHVFSFCFILVFFIPFAIVIYRYCNRTIGIFFAYLLYLALFHNLAMFGARQVYSMGFGMLFFLCYSDNKYKSAIIFLLIGITLHLSNLLMLIPFVLSIIPERHIKKLHIATILSIPFVLISAKIIIYNMGSLVGMERYANYGQDSLHGGAITYIVLSEILSIICLYLTNDDCFGDNKFRYLYIMAPVFTFFIPLIYVDGTMMRVAAYSQIYVTVLFPYLIYNRHNTNANKYLIPFIIVLIILMLRNGYQPYHFFWEVDPVYLW